MTQPIEQAKKVYVTPSLVEYGSIAKLTQNNAAGSNTDNTDMMVGACL